MKAYAIVIKGHDVSEKAYKHLEASSRQVQNNFEISRFDAITPDKTDLYMDRYDLKWTWPWRGTEICRKTNIRMHAYGTRDPKRRIACFLSHFFLWKKCVELDEPILILEHDALFLKKLDYQYILDSDYGIIGLNDPRGATRLPMKFHQIVQDAPGPLLNVPTIDRMEVAQGIAGASAYIAKPFACQEIIDKVYEIGAWPNDATICQQIFPWIGVTKDYYTKVQGTRSTTST